MSPLLFVIRRLYQSLHHLLRHAVCLLRRLSLCSLRKQLIIIAFIMVSVPTLTIGYVVKTEGQSTLITEKQKKLMAITQLLDQQLANHFADYANLPASERITALNHLLSPVTERITSAFPGVGAGYYHRQLDAIITYAPDAQFHSKVGVSIAGHHPGRRVMMQNTPLISSGLQVRGNIMNYMLPVVRQHQVIGYIWANELIEDIEQQTQHMDSKILLVLFSGLVLSLAFIIPLSHRLSTNIDVISRGLAALAENLHSRLPQLPGDMGKISHSVNALAKALQESKTLNELIIENATDGVLAIDRQGIITAVNPAAKQITGYHHCQLVGKPCERFFTVDFYQPILATLRQQENCLTCEISVQLQNKSVELIMKTSQVHNASNQLIGVLVIFSDLTASKEKQQRLARTERLATLGELMAGVAHEVRNPLTAIKGYVQILCRQDSSPVHQEYFTIILQEINSLNRLIQQLLDFARPPHSKRHAVRLNNLIETSLTLVQPYASHTRIRFNLKLQPNLTEIIADAELLKQVLLNLLINAIQAIGQQGEITIYSWQYTDQQQAISIEDNGCGIRAEHQKKVFDPFFTTKATGTGLGLAFCQRIIYDHQGNILLHSIAGKGARFTVILPQREEAITENESAIQHTHC